MQTTTSYRETFRIVDVIDGVAQTPRTVSIPTHSTEQREKLARFGSGYGMAVETVETAADGTVVVNGTNRNVVRP